MKLAIRNYCNEGHDILRAEDMREALINHAVKGTTCSVNQIDKAAQSIKVKNIAQYNNFHNFQFEEGGIRMWRVYGIGAGKVLPYSTMVVPVILSQQLPDAALEGKSTSSCSHTAR